MYKKRILSVVIASAFALGGCSNDGAGPASTSLPTSAAEAGTGNPFTGGTYPMFNPGAGALPIPNDLLFQQDQAATSAVEQKDGSFAVPNFFTKQVLGTLTPPEVAYENLSGASLTAPIDIEMSGSVNPSTVNGRAWVMSGSTPVPNPSQSVFLIELEYASQSPVTALTAGEAPTLAVALASGAQLVELANRPAYDAKVVTLNKLVNGVKTPTDYIRITPLKPLKPNKRYVVVITTDVRDTNGNPLTRSPGTTGYSVLTNATGPMVSPSLVPIRDLINKLWEPIAVNYFGALTNASRAGLPAPAPSPLTVDNVVLSYSFTTSNDTEVVDYMVEPSKWINATLSRMVREAGAKAAVAGGATSYSAIKTTVDGAYNSWVASTLAPHNATLTAALSSNCPTSSVPAGAAQFACAAAVLQNIMTAPPSFGGLGLTLPNPKANTRTEMNFTAESRRNVRRVSSVITSAIAPLNDEPSPGRVAVNMAEATLKVPYYSGLPTANGTDPGDNSQFSLVNDWWRADIVLATAVDALLRAPGATTPAIPQADTDGTNFVRSDVVNGFFPFAQSNGNVNIPLLAIYPANAANKPAGGYKTVIYQHGITTDRSAALTLGSALVANSGGTVAVVAIDQPLHGVDHATTRDKRILSETLMAAGGILTSPDGVFDGQDADEQAKIEAVVNGTFTVGVLQTIQAAPCPALAGLDLSGATPADIVTAITRVTASPAQCGDTAKESYLSADTLVRTVANAASQIPGLPGKREQERHFGFAGVNLVPLPINFSNGDSIIGASSSGTGSGSMTINIGNFLTSRDNFRQQIMDLMTLRMSIANMDVDGDGTPDLNPNDVHFIGHSLGTLNGIPFVEIANNTTTTADDIRSATFLTPGGNISRLAENSEAFGPRIMLGLQAAAGLGRGDADYETFISGFQAALDSFDPINFVGNLKSTVTPTKALFIEARNDSTIPNSASPALDIVQPATLTSLTINNQGTTTINDDTVSVSSVANPYAGISFGPGTPAPLGGTEPLFAVSGSTKFNATVGSTSANLYHAVFGASSGFKHGTPVLPATSPEVPSFGEMVGQVASFVMSNGNSIVVTNGTLLETP